jgi:hypothetical protein
MDPLLPKPCPWVLEMSMYDRVSAIRKQNILIKTKTKRQNPTNLEVDCRCCKNCTFKQKNMFLIQTG